MRSDDFTIFASYSTKDWHESYDILMDHLRKSGFCVKTEKEKMPNEVCLEFVSAVIFEKTKKNYRSLRNFKKIT